MLVLRKILITSILTLSLLYSQAAFASGCVLGPIEEVSGGPYPTTATWDGWAGDMSSPGPFNRCQASNYIGVSYGGDGVFGSYADCGALDTGDFSPNGACVKSVWANCGGNLSCATQCSVGILPCAGPGPINGSCGPAAGAPTLSTPTTGLCNAGSDGGVTLAGNIFSWTCNGSGGGSNDNCSAPQIINGTCGPADGTPTGSAPAAGLCNSGNASALSGTGPWTWTCDGINTGSTQTCTAPLPPPPPTFGGACP